MKKLMFAAAAAALSATVFADVTSANIVGYGPSPLQQAGLSAGATFAPMTADGLVDLADLVVKGYLKEDGSDGDVNVSTLNENGGTEVMYYWIDAEDGDDKWYGWYTDSDLPPIDKGVVQIQLGEGLWFYSGADGFSIQSNGEVPTKGDIEVTLQQAGLTVANPTPLMADLAKCKVGGYLKEDGSDGDVNVSTLNENGGTKVMYYWIDAEDGEDKWYGWYTDSDLPPLAEGVEVLNPGEGLWSYSSANGFTFVWPKVEIAD